MKNGVRLLCYIYLFFSSPGKNLRDPGSNQGPPDLQSGALPTELSRKYRFVKNRRLAVRMTTTLCYKYKLCINNFVLRANWKNLIAGTLVQVLTTTRATAPRVSPLRVSSPATSHTTHPRALCAAKRSRRSNASPRIWQTTVRHRMTALRLLSRVLTMNGL